MYAVVEVHPRASSSSTMLESSRGSPIPPMDSGAYRAQKPSAPARSIASLGNTWSASQRAACGPNSRSLNSRAVSRNARWSAVRPKSISAAGSSSRGPARGASWNQRAVTVFVSV